MNFRTLALAACVPVVVAAQASGPLDRTKPPALPKPPVLRLPAVERGALPNGVRLQVVAHRQLPLVQVTLVVAGGSKLDGARPGLASFTARMLTEGAGARDANALQSELAFLGAQLSAYSGWDAFTVSLNVPKRTLAPALDLLADVVLRPSFRAADVKQQRDLRLASILQRRDQPSILATLAFSQVVFPVGHPYHRAADGDSTSTAALDSSTVRAFYDGAFVPGRSKFVVGGDVSETEIRGLLSSRFGAWKARATAAAMPAVTVAPVSNAAVRLYLVDKPGAAQSVIYLGGPGADRLGADYPALTVMNTILGGSFSSRLNSLLRETRG